MRRHNLTSGAQDVIRAAGLSVAGYVRFCFPDGLWYGDRCGCSDDRCIGYHHDEEDECYCLPVLLAEALVVNGLERPFWL